MEKLGSHCKDFHEILYLNIFRKSIEKFQVWLKSDKNNGCFTGRPMYVYGNSLIISFGMRNVSDRSCSVKPNTHFFLENSAFCEIMWKNIVEPGGLQMKLVIWRMRCACWMPKASDTH